MIDPFSCVVATVSSFAPPLACRWSDVLGNPAPLAMNEALRLAPATRYSELAPHVRPTTLQEVDAVRTARKGQLEGAVEVIGFAMTVDQSLQCPLDLNAPSALKKGVRLAC